uniref:Uncharacterized protein n=1 Tax=Vespula pensylvanica TaxID=30213 RepID=A0A834UAP2_VESPE|nr:hypothetical protein H0235_006538 [Vespula pensylvanica]
MDLPVEVIPSSENTVASHRTKNKGSCPRPITNCYKDSPSPIDSTRTLVNRRISSIENPAQVRSVSTGFGRTVSPYDNFHEREKTVVYHNYPRMAEERAFVGSPCWLRPRIEPPSENGSADGLMLNHTSTKF